MKYLSKTNYLNSLECMTKLQMMVQNTFEKKELDPMARVNIKNGFELEELVHDYFVDIYGKDRCVTVDCDFFEMEKSIKVTSEFDAKFEVIFEAAVCEGEFEGAFSRSDVRVKVDNGVYDIFEIKASSKVKSEYIVDIAYQARIYKSKGLKLRNLYVITIDSNYIHDENFSRTEMAKKLLVLNDVTKKVEDLNLKLSKEDIDEILKTVNSNEYIDKKPERKCRDCENREKCWASEDSRVKIPEYGVMDALTTSWRTKDKLLAKGIYDLETVKEMIDRGEFYVSGDKSAPKGSLKLTKAEKIDILAYTTNRNHIDKEQLKKILSQVKFPIYSLDYETVSKTVPRFHKSSPRQQIPFQYSLHKLDKNGTLTHMKFLQRTPKDGREALVNQLKRDIEKDGGSVMVYNKKFENGVNAKLGEFMDDKSWSNKLNARLWDLMEIFQNRVVYYKEQKTSFSLKAVGPALLGELGDLYKDLDIKNGEEALSKYFDFLDTPMPDNVVKKLMDGLDDYCEVDTLLPLYILKKLFCICQMEFPEFDTKI